MPSLEHLFAMKVVADRPKDQRDIGLLAAELGLTADGYVRLVESIYGDALDLHVSDRNDFRLTINEAIRRAAR